MRTRALWGALILAVAVAVTAFAVISARRLGTQEPPEGALAADLADRVTGLMEQDFRALAADGDESVVCAAQPFGVRPEGLTDAARATTIYAWVYCRSQTDGDGDRALLTPVAVRLDKPPSIRVPEHGAGRERSIQRIFPADVRKALRATDRSDLRASVEDRSGAAG